jgi:hypothetical protein
MNLQELIIKLEIVISKLGINPGLAKQGEGQYSISKDQKTQVFIDAFEENGRVFFQVMTPIMTLSSKDKAEWTERLLKENHGLVDASFALIEDTVLIKHTTEYKSHLTEEGIIEHLQRLAHYNEVFSEKFEVETLK